MRRLVLMGLALLTLGACVVALDPAASVLAAPKDEICAGANPGGDCTGGGSQLNRVVAVAINIMSAFIGIAAVIMVIFAGFKYITSAGDSSSISSAKTTLVYAIIGLIIVAFAQFIVQFVLTRVGTLPK